MSTTLCCLHLALFLIFIFSPSINLSHLQLTSLTHTGVSSIIELCSSQASASHWNTCQPYLFSSRHHLPSINSYPILLSLSSLQHQNSLLFNTPPTELWNSLPLHIRISLSLSTLFNQFYLNSTISSLATVYFKRSPRHHLSLIHVPYIWLFTHHCYLFIISCILHLATYTSSSFVHKFMYLTIGFCY